MGCGRVGEGVRRGRCVDFRVGWLGRRKGLPFQGGLKVDAGGKGEVVRKVVDLEFVSSV